MKKIIRVIIAVTIALLLTGLIAFGVLPTIKEKRILAARCATSVPIGFSYGNNKTPDSVRHSGNDSIARSPIIETIQALALSETASLVLTVNDTHYLMNPCVDERYRRRNPDLLWEHTARHMALTFNDSHGTQTIVMDDSVIYPSRNGALCRFLSYLEANDCYYVLYTFESSHTGELRLCVLNTVTNQITRHRWPLSEYQPADWEPSFIFDIASGALINTKLSDLPYVILNIKGKDEVWEIDGPELSPVSRINYRFNTKYWIRPFIM